MATPTPPTRPYIPTRRSGPTWTPSRSGARIRVTRPIEPAPLTTRQVAELCDVNLKTVHNWVSEARIPHFRTPGRHLRFRPDDVVAFLRRSGFAVPPELVGRRALLIGFVGESYREVLKARGFDMRVEGPYRALVAAAAERPHVVIVDADAISDLKPTEFIAALHEAAPGARVVWVGPHPGLGGVVTVDGHSVSALMDALI